MALISAVLKSHSCVCTAPHPPNPPSAFAVQLLAQNSHSCVSHSKQKINLCALCVLGVCMCVFVLTSLLPIAVQPQLASKSGKYVFFKKRIVGKVWK